MVSSPVRVPLCHLMMLAAASEKRWCAMTLLMFSERSWDASTALSTGSSVTEGPTKSSTSPWGTPFMSWTFLIVRDQAWTAGHRKKRRHTDEMLERFPSEIFMAHDNSGDVAMVLRWAWRASALVPQRFSSFPVCLLAH